MTRCVNFLSLMLFLCTIAFVHVHADLFPHRPGRFYRNENLAHASNVIHSRECVSGGFDSILLLYIDLSTHLAVSEAFHWPQRSYS